MSTAPDSEPTAAADEAVSRPGTGSGPGSGSSGAAAPEAVLPESGAAPGKPPAPAGLVFDDPLDRPSSDDTDRGWGDPLYGSADDDFTRFLSQKPPHHL